MESGLRAFILDGLGWHKGRRQPKPIWLEIFRTVLGFSIPSAVHIDSSLAIPECQCVGF